MTERCKGRGCTGVRRGGETTKTTLAIPRVLTARILITAVNFHLILWAVPTLRLSSIFEIKSPPGTASGL